MEQLSISKSYEFVVSSSAAGLPTDQGTRRLIRRQAMSRAAAARRQKGSWGKHNLGQYPVSCLDLEDEEKQGDDAAASGSAREGSSLGQQGHPPAMTAKMTVPANVPSSGYESMRIDHGFDLLDVSALTTFHSGRITARLLSREPFRLAHVLQYRQWSYFSFLPSRYGHTACLDDAANCVAARVRQWMSSPSEPPCKWVLSLYTKSLTSLQSALNDPVLYLKPEVLCATAILAIYEVRRAFIKWNRRLLTVKAFRQHRQPSLGTTRSRFNCAVEASRTTALPNRFRESPIYFPSWACRKPPTERQRATTDI